MYIDKLYNKLFSDNNIEGLNILMSELRTFSCSMLDKKDEVAKDKANNIIKSRGIHDNKTKKLIRKQVRANVRGDRN